MLIRRCSNVGLGNERPRKRKCPRIPDLRMPAEWEPHEATWLSWPHEKTDWPGKFAPIPWVYAEIVRNLARVERVRILVRDRAEEKAAKRILKKSGADLEGRGFFSRADESRMDSGFWSDICARERMANWPRRIGCSMRGRSTRMARRDASGGTRNWRRQWRKWKIQVRQPMYKGTRVVLEGGGIEVNGRGTLMTTEEWLLSPTQVRNPGI